ncbi:ribonuclease HI family protein [candidate division WWE3 bacterium]|uniref:Ribonuclease HI family protein n=1 Tax=candidate division WWE3 bacterium TaxID=2053526 RepID=A0A7X9DL34_UNCKA|nr:ribonuclease HI family protein [candidate division WWE3 bacterium]
MIKLNINTDGGSRGNPGPGAIGVVINNENDKPIYEMGKTIGYCTNNEAEYTALIEALIKAKDFKATHLTMRLDSELVVKQLNGQYKVKNDRILVLWKKAKELASGFAVISFVHVPREKNKEADKLVNDALDAEIIK